MRGGWSSPTPYTPMDGENKAITTKKKKKKKKKKKNVGARVVTTLFINFSDAQGQLTPKSVMESCRNSNPSKLLWLVLLSARMKKIHRKMKILEWSQHFSHYKSMGIFPDAQGQLTHKSLI